MPSHHQGPSFISKMQKWKNKTRAPARSFTVQLTIHSIAELPVAELQGRRDDNYLMVQVGWKCNKRLITSYLSKHAAETNCTTKKHIHSGDSDSVTWDEEFNRDCKLKLLDPQRFKKYEISMELFRESSQAATSTATFMLGKVKLNVAEFASPSNRSRREIEIFLPVKCSVRGSIAISKLTVTLAISEVQIKGNIGMVYPLSPTTLLPSLSLCMRIHDPVDNRLSPNQFSDSSEAEFSSDEEPDFSYKNLTVANNFPVDVKRNTVDSCRNEDHEELQSPNYQLNRQSSLGKLRSLNRRFMSFKSPQRPKDIPLLNKDEDGGDDIDSDRRFQTSPSQTRNKQQEDDFRASGFLSSDRFEVGSWERRKLKSRDGKLELVTEFFLASIDQCSEKAAGNSACTVLATVIADWLHQNPKTLPLKCELNKLIREGSSEWRRLCLDDNHKDKFYDQHFDLETVLQAEVRPIAVVPEKSYVGFFLLENMPENLPFLQGVMSFDSVWEELDSNEITSEQIFIVSWNDHFFVLKIEMDAIYVIDTLGERLFEGCKKAYMLKFSKESKLYQVKGQTQNTSPQVISEGKTTCKEFIKEFLAALPLSELRANIKAGKEGDAPLHQLLQIEFHCTTSCRRNFFPG